MTNLTRRDPSGSASLLPSPSPKPVGTTATTTASTAKGPAAHSQNLLCESRRFAQRPSATCPYESDRGIAITTAGLLGRLLFDFGVDSAVQPAVSSPLVAALPKSYTDAREQRLTARGALRAVLNYATDFITRGDIDVLFTISGGAIQRDGHSADPAVWADWLSAWRAVQPQADDGSVGERQVDVQHGYRALLVFLERDYKPIDQTPMSRVRDDCIAALHGGSEATDVCNRWEAAIASGENADIAFRLAGPNPPPIA